MARNLTFGKRCEDGSSTGLRREKKKDEEKIAGGDINITCYERKRDSTPSFPLPFDKKQPIRMDNKASTMHIY